MVSSGVIFALLPCVIALFIASWVVMLEYSFSRTPSGGNLDLYEGAHGVEMRGWMQVVLSLAALCRAVALCLDMLDLLPFEEDAVYPPYHAAADIFYLSVYSLLTLLWGQLCLVAKGHRERILRTIFTVGLGSFYLLFGTTVIAVVSSHHSPKFHTILANMALAELGTANAIVGTLILCFGVRVIIFTQTHGDIALRRPWALSCRTILLTLVCSVACLLRCALSFSICVGKMHPIDIMNNPKWARKFSLFVWMADVVPTWVLLLLTLRLQGMKPYRIMTRDLNQYRLPVSTSQGLLGVNSQTVSPQRDDINVSPMQGYGAISSSGRSAATSPDFVGLHSNPHLPEESRSDCFVLPTQ